MNKWMLSGFIGNDPEIRHTPSGQPVTNFRVATNFVRTKEDGTQDKRTDWHRMVAFGKTAELIHEFFKKGSFIEVECRVQNRSWVNGDGNTVWQTEGVVERFGFGPKVNKTTTEAAVEAPAEPIPASEDAPF